MKKSTLLIALGGKPPVEDEDMSEEGSEEAEAEISDAIDLALDPDADPEARREAFIRAVKGCSKY